MDFTYDEQQLMAIYNGGTREKTIAALKQMRPHLDVGGGRCRPSGAHRFRACQARQHDRRGI